MKKRNRLLSILTICSLLTSCLDIENTETHYIQFTRDDLSYLVCNNDSVTFKGETIYFNDTLHYLLNNTDTFDCYISTQIFKVKPMLSLTDFYFISGFTDYTFEGLQLIESAKVSVSRNSDFGNAEAQLYIDDNGGSWGVSNFNNSTQYSLLDSVVLNGKCYSNVYKFDNLQGLSTNVKTVYFVKQFGFIKIETMDGNTLEREL